jgi:UDP-N-acetyl-D-galactosamine dehydrogenase
VVDIYRSLEEYTRNITVYDPWANSDRVEKEYGIKVESLECRVESGKYDAIILAVAHDQFKNMDVSKLVRPGGVIYDVKGILPRDIIDGRL